MATEIHKGHCLIFESLVFRKRTLLVGEKENDIVIFQMENDSIFLNQQNIRTLIEHLQKQIQ
jgi:hypothetical protein